MADVRVWWKPKLADCRSVVVRAWLQAGCVLDPTWPQTLDGVLASVERAHRLGERRGFISDHHQPRLPIAVAWKGGPFSHHTGSQWWFHASCATPIDHHGEPIAIDDLDHQFVDWWHKRPVGVKALDRGIDVSTSVLNGTVGRFRAWRMPEVVTVCAALEWRVVGVPDQLEVWCQKVRQVGAGWGKGNGVVLKVELDDVGPADPLWAVWGRDDRIGRPVPARCAESLGVAGCDTVQAAIRPPYWRPPQTEQPGGGFAREWRSVIAPWTRRPTP